MALIQTLTPAGTTTASFTSIPGTYNHLQIIGYGATSAAASFSNVSAKFNTDAGTNYGYVELFGNSTTAAAQNAGGVAPTSAFPLQLSGQTGPPANSQSAFVMTIAGYAQTTFNKVALTQYSLVIATGGTGLYIVNTHLTWVSTAAITQIDLILASGNWATGSTVYLYGIT